MADIFLSYKKTDKERVAPIVALLELSGWSVWWDTRIDAGEKWDEVIEREVDAASCVVAVWSFESVTSRWVRTEASEGLERGVLVPIFIDPAKPPLEFKLVQSIYMVGWRGDAGDPAARTLLGAVGRFLGPAPTDAGHLSSELEALNQERLLREQEHWELIRKSRDPRQFSAFLAAYPSGRFAGAAMARIEQLAVRAERVKGMGRAIYSFMRRPMFVLSSLVAGLVVAVWAVLWQQHAEERDTAEGLRRSEIRRQAELKVKLRREAEEAERQRLAVFKVEQDRKRAEEESKRAADAAAAKKKADEEARAKRVAEEEVERQRLAMLKAEEQRQAEKQRKAEEDKRLKEERRQAELNKRAKAYRYEPKLKRVWAAVKGSTSIAALEEFRREYGPANTVYDRLAEARIEDLRQAEKRLEERKKRQAAVVVPVPAPQPEMSVPSRAAAPLTVAEESALKTKDGFRECDECPEMVVVPAGEFTMGSPETEAGRTSDEGPPRKVVIARPFAVGKFEVTFAEWDACVAGGSCIAPWPNDSGWGRGRRPVINVSWEQVTKDYLPWLSRQAGKTYRLLTEAEWEYAARAGTTTPFSTGRLITSDEANGNYTYGRDHRRMTLEVGSFKPNAFGLHDMHGNVWEWVQDCYQSSYARAPVDGSAVIALICSYGGYRVSRGGSWDSYPSSLRSANRSKDHPNFRSHFSGFRVARTLVRES